MRALSWLPARRSRWQAAAKCLPPAVAPVGVSALDPEPARPPALDVNIMLHAARGAHLGAMPRGARRLLSAGCAGLWYFEWIEQRYGPVEEHIGIEYYTPRPEGLPANVTWIANSVAEMTAVADGSCDLVFSGQNIEHLWPDETAGFLVESARVLRPGGHLVIDSPNRTITAALNWSHPEHTIELTLAEITSLVQLAGLTPTKAVGLWLCQDPRSGRILPFDPNAADAEWQLTDRLVAAAMYPEQSFIWWLEAARTARAPDPDGIAATLDGIFRTHWPERVGRMTVPEGRVREQHRDGEWVRAAPGGAGPVFFGPSMPLRSGHYRATFRLDPDPAVAEPYALCEVVCRDHDAPLAELKVAPGERSPCLGFSLPATTFGLQFRLSSLGIGGFAAHRGVVLEETEEGGFGG